LAGDCFTVAHPDDAAESRAWFENLDPAQRRTFHFDRRFLHKSGREIHALLNISVARDAADEPLYFVAHIHDQTEQRRAQWMETDRRLALEMVAQDRPLPTVLHQLVQLIERQMPLMQACIMLLQDGTIRPFGENLPPELAAAIAKRPVSFSAGLTCTSIKHVPMPLVADVETHRAWDELRGEARGAGVKCCWGVTVRGGDGVPLGLVLVMVHERRSPSSAERDILETATRLAAISIEHHQTTRLLAHLVRHDPLTSLPNRVMFEDRLHQAMAAARRNNKPLGLLALDLNRFKQVNDTLGHQAGDSLLQLFSQRLAAQLRESDTLARVGGDEFLVILPAVASRSEAGFVAERLIAALAAAPFEVGGQSLAVTSSIGIAMYPDDADDTVPLQRAADAAMYRAKEEGRTSMVAVSVVKSAG
jgi:diguanylate cyclase (GGDEF)-like protein